MIEKYLPVEPMRHMRTYCTGTIISTNPELNKMRQDVLCNIFRPIGMQQTDFDKLCVEFCERMNSQSVGDIVKDGIEENKNIVEKVVDAIVPKKRGRPSKESR